MNKYLYNLCICVFSAVFVIQANDASGANRSKQSTFSQKGKVYNSSKNSQKKFARNSNRKATDEEVENEEDTTNDEEEEVENEDRRTKKPTLSELKECQCVQAYIKLTKDDNDEEEDSSRKKTLKKRNYEDDEEEQEEENKYSNNNKSNINRRNTKQSNRKDESWKHKKADISHSLEKYKIAPLLNKQSDIFGIKLAANSVSSHAHFDKNTSCDKEENIKDRNESMKHKHNYRIDQKESIKFRQDLEKYRQVYA